MSVLTKWSHGGVRIFYVSFSDTHRGRTWAESQRSLPVNIQSSIPQASKTKKCASGSPHNRAEVGREAFEVSRSLSSNHESARNRFVSTPRGSSSIVWGGVISLEERATEAFQVGRRILEDAVLLCSGSSPRLTAFINILNSSCCFLFASQQKLSCYFPGCFRRSISVPR